MKSHRISSLIIATSMIAWAVPSIAATPREVETASDNRYTLFEGDWEGPIGATQLLFRFQVDNGTLVGWFVSRKNGQSYPLKNIQVKGRTLSFIYPSKPELSYVVTAQKGDQILSGISARPDGDATPRTLVRVPRQ